MKRVMNMKGKTENEQKTSIDWSRGLEMDCCPESSNEQSASSFIVITTSHTHTLTIHTNNICNITLMKGVKRKSGASGRR